MPAVWPEIAMRGGPSQMLFWSFSGGTGQVREPLDTVSGNLRQGVAHAASRDDTVRRDLGERNQHKGALEHARMRQGQLFPAEPDVVIGEQVEVECARTPMLLMGAVAAEFLLDLVQREQ